MNERTIVERETISFLCPRCCHHSELKCTVSIEYTDSCYVNGERLNSAFYRVRFDCPSCGEEMIEIDAGLVKSISALWRCGIATYMCCEGHVDGSYITPASSSNIPVIGPHIDFPDTRRRRKQLQHIVGSIDSGEIRIGHYGVYRWSNHYGKYLRLYVVAGAGLVDRADSQCVSQIKTNLDLAKDTLFRIVYQLCEAEAHS